MWKMVIWASALVNIIAIEQSPQKDWACLNGPIRRFGVYCRSIYRRGESARRLGILLFQHMVSNYEHKTKVILISGSDGE